MSSDDLKQRVSTAVGADRQLDCALHGLVLGEAITLIGAERSGWSHDFGYPTRELPTVGSNDAGGWAGALDHMRAVVVPRYTASIDAALSLRDCLLSDREIGVFDDKENACWWAQIGDDHWDESMDNIRARGGTAALALVAAILEAHSPTKAGEP